MLVGQRMSGSQATCSCAYNTHHGRCGAKQHVYTIYTVLLSLRNHHHHHATREHLRPGCRH